MHFTYKKKIFLYFLIVFTIFTVIIVAVQQNREKMYKSENFKASLNAYAEIIANYVDSHRLIADKRLDSLNNLLPLLPRGLRVSIIDRQGKVLYDNDIDEEETVENHLSRPEIAQALTQSNGTNIGDYRYRLLLRCPPFQQLFRTGSSTLYRSGTEYPES